MTDTDQKKREDEVLKRMLKTPPKPHKPLDRERVKRSATGDGKGRKKA